jgi:hypothetical protein
LVSSGGSTAGLRIRLAKKHRPQGGKGAADEEKSKASEPTQVGAGLLLTGEQLLLPMIEGMVHSRRELFGWVQQVGIRALKELFQLEVVQLAGPTALG